MLIYDKSGRELRHRILLTSFVVEIWPSEGLTLLRFFYGPYFHNKKDNKILWRNSLPLLS